MNFPYRMEVFQWHYILNWILSLDLALPLFQWGVVFREKQMIQLINQLSQAELSDTTRFQFINNHRWQVLKSTYLRGQYVYKGDVIRLETSSYQTLTEAMYLLQPYFKGKEFDLVFYHFEEEVLEEFSVGNIRRLMERL